MLITEDATVVIQSKDKKTALSLAAEHNHPEIIKVYTVLYHGRNILINQTAP